MKRNTFVGSLMLTDILITWAAIVPAILSWLARLLVPISEAWETTAKNKTTSNLHNF